ncbi:MAG: hypothetical protein ABI860_12155, partial [Gemmatimonadales bacterium]
DRGRNTPHSALAPTPPLAVRVQAGDTAAYDPLVRRHMRAAFGVAYRILRAIGRTPRTWCRRRSGGAGRHFQTARTDLIISGDDQ